MAVSRVVLVVVALLLTACGGSGSSDSSADRGEGDGDGDRRWGDDAYGVVLAHGAAFDADSWSPQATAIAEQGATVIAVEDITPDSIERAAMTLRDEGIERVALVGGSAGADAILELASEQPELPDQLILLSPNSTVSGLGEEPKLFIASEDEGVADVSRDLAAESPGSDNEAVLLPGSAHAQNIFDSDQGDRVEQLILDRLAARS